MLRTKPFQIAVLCGGPSLERGISLNSARSVCDHLHSDNLQIVPIYFDHHKRAFQISRSQLYSNTPSDFDFKLATSAKALNAASLVKTLKSVDLVFPAMHGPFGEDGELQTLLETHRIPFVGSPSAACQLAFDKFDANTFLKSKGLYSIPSLLIERGDKETAKRLQNFFRLSKSRRFIVKPAIGGSSIAVYAVASVKEALEKIKIIFSQRSESRIVVEPFLSGREFTVILLENPSGEPVAVLPTEIEMDQSNYQIFDYRKKYLATRQVTYHCPPRFSDRHIAAIQTQAQNLFKLFGMRDFARFDGWILDDGNLYFSDFNPISGMEQNSFLFMQAARLGLSHRQVLRYVLQSACRRYGLKLPRDKEASQSGKLPVNVIFGGGSAERQVSLMSGTNVWLKLRRSIKYSPVPHLLDFDGMVWKIPYGLALNHTVEEVLAMCKTSQKDEARLFSLKAKVCAQLRLSPKDCDQPWFRPKRMSISSFIKSSKFVFIGLHGGIGEDGTLQSMLEKAGVPFNGPGSSASRLCMNKFKTGQALSGLEHFGILSAKKKILKLGDLRKFSKVKYKKLWLSLLTDLDSETIIVKPIDDGCSAGIARIYSAKDLQTYCECAMAGTSNIPPETLSHQKGIIEMPNTKMENILCEAFIITDKVMVEKKQLKWKERSGWVEITVGVLQTGKRLRALSPSITVAEGSVLSLEEKFQGGTGVNITPPPSPFVPERSLTVAKRNIEIVAKKLGLQGYSRIDAFLHRKSGNLIIIEVNTLPGLTPSTVIYHQALTEAPALYPTQFLEKIVQHGLAR